MTFPFHLLSNTYPLSTINSSKQMVTCNLVPSIDYLFNVRSVLELLLLIDYSIDLLHASILRSYMIDYLMFGYEFDKILAAAGYDLLSAADVSAPPLLSSAEDRAHSALPLARSADEPLRRSKAEASAHPLLSSAEARGHSAASDQPSLSNGEPVSQAQEYSAEATG